MSLYQEARVACRELGFQPRKRLGQHFLVRESVIAAILRLVGLSLEDEILEIGPGMGSLTREIVKIARKVWAIEVDPVLVQWLRSGPLGRHPGLELIQGDILKVHLGEILPDRKVKVVANLPYSISSPVLFRLMEERKRFSVLVLMVQREVAERITASPGTKSYGTLSVWCQIHGQVLDKISVSHSAFFPRPKVDSTVLKISLYPDPLLPPDSFASLRAVVRASFGQRRKTLSNALRGLGKGSRDEIDGLLRQVQIDPQRRGETLNVGEFIRLARALETVLGDGQ